MRTYTLLVFGLVSTNCAADIISEAQVYVENAVHEYIESGPRAFIQISMKDGPLEGNAQTLSIANTLQQAQDLAGAPKSYEFVSATKLSERSVMVLYVIYLEKAPLYCNSLIYKTAAGQFTSMSVNFDTRPEKVWPSKRVYGQ